MKIKKGGYTLVEFMVIVIIVGLTILLSIPVFQTVRERRILTKERHKERLLEEASPQKESLEKQDEVVLEKQDRSIQYLLRIRELELELERCEERNQDLKTEIIDLEFKLIRQ